MTNDPDGADDAKAHREESGDRQAGAQTASSPVGAIQPHGLVLIADLSTRMVVGAAGNLEERLTPAWSGRPIDKLLAQDVDAAIEAAMAEPDTAIPLAVVPGRKEAFDASLLISGGHILVELEPRAADTISAAWVLARLDALRASFAEAPNLGALCDVAAQAFRALTGFDRVMLYRILEDGSGVVLAEDRDADADPGLPSFLNAHFPASDIPQRARDLSVRNRVRSIPDTGYVPAPVQWSEAATHAGIDLGTSGLRSVAPDHIQYLKDLGVAASTSISIVRDDTLWGMIACHNVTPKALDFDRRAVCRTFADELGREIGAQHDAEVQREHERLRAAENALISRFDQDAPFERFFTAMAEDMRAFLGADGFAAIQGDIVVRTPGCPERADLLELARWARSRAAIEPFATDQLAERFPPAEAYRDRASGMLAVSLTTLVSTLMLWFRAEESETVDWIGSARGKGAAGAPFGGWRETVGGRARRWTFGEIAAATRLRRSLFGMRQSYRVRQLSKALDAAVAERDRLQDELGSRAENSVALIQMLLGLQPAATNDAAQRRIGSVKLVHRALHQPDSTGTIDLARYLDDLIRAMREEADEAAHGPLSLDLAPVQVSSDRAAAIGLIVIESIDNAYRHAYDCQTGPIAIELAPHRGRLRLSVADRGVGTRAGTAGFGMRMMEALARRIGGTIDYHQARTGMRVVLSAPVDRV